MRLLVVDDDAEVRDLLVRALERDGHVVWAVGTCEATQSTLAMHPADVVVLDLALPDGNGIALCRTLRTASNTVPILMLTAHAEIATRVRSLDAGADDFLAKPFAVAELRARVRALGRRREATFVVPMIAFDGVHLDLGSRRAVRHGRSISLTAREWAIIEALALRVGRLVPRPVLLEEVWGEATESAGTSLEVIIGRIRRKIGDGFIRTVRGEGYVLEVG